MNRFIFSSYVFDSATTTAHFKYGLEDGRRFVETVQFATGTDYNAEVLDQAMKLAFILIGTSYYKAYPSTEVLITEFIDDWQADFFTHVYQEGLSQFAYENELKRSDLAVFTASQSTENISLIAYEGLGTLVLQSGGKDSLLTATLLQKRNKEFVPWYLSSSVNHPVILDNLSGDLQQSIRTIDRDGLLLALKDGGLKGHVPITYIVQSLALIQAILLNKRDVLVSIAHEGEEPHAYIDDLSVTHQWSKTWTAEQSFAQYVKRYIASTVRIGSPLRQLTELRVAELFVDHAWEKYGHQFSSCNVANYRQGRDNSTLQWCGDCPKCANSYLLFAPFLASNELKSIFNNQDLFSKITLQKTFRGLLGIDGETKPFECVGEINELRLAYQKAQSKGGYESLDFDVPESSFDYIQIYPAQDWAVEMLQ